MIIIAMRSKSVEYKPIGRGCACLATNPVSGSVVKKLWITRKTTMVLYFCTDVTLTHIQ